MLTRTETEEMLGKYRLPLSEWYDWISGQTCPVKDGVMYYYRYDVERFVYSKITGLPTNFD